MDSILLINQILDCLLPEKCALCHRRDRFGFCHECRPLLPWKHCFCYLCSIELPVAGICGQCQTAPPYYASCAIPFHYRAPISEKIHQLKYNNRLYYCSPLAKMLCRWLDETQLTKPQLIVPIPLHKHRLRQRGFNQALEIAKIVSSRLTIPLDASLLSRSSNTPSQTGLSEKERALNVKNAFTLQKRCHYSHIALIDDVVTSGSTVNEAAKLLIKSGTAEKVSVWALSKT